VARRKRYFDVVKFPCFLEPCNSCVPLLGVNPLDIEVELRQNKKFRQTARFGFFEFAEQEIRKASTLSKRIQ